MAQLKQLRQERFFSGWDGFVDVDHVKASEASVCRLIDDLIALGPKMQEEAARAAVDECVRRFNDLDNGWICTIERDDIFEQIGRAIDVCGFDYREEWIDERDW